jgi:hypothetical protein
LSVARAASSIVALIAIGGGLPDGCARALGRHADPTPGASAAPAVPIASATTPPVWAPPEPPPPATPAPAVSPELAKARAYAQAGDHKRVRALLEKKVKAGKGSKEEAALLVGACLALRDKSCVEAARARHPDVDEP